MKRSFHILTFTALIGCGPPWFGLGSSDESGSDTTSTTSSESSETPDGEDSTDGTTASFVPKIDVQETHECDPFLQDCPADEKCVPYSTDGGPWNANKCVPVMGDQKPGDPCIWGGLMAGTDDCDQTGICWDVQEVDGQWVGTCTQFCGGTPDLPECPANAYCLVSSNGEINLCIPNCDPLIQDCGDGLACYLANNHFNCVFTTQNLPAGAPCEYINDCAAGHLCVTAEALPSCEGSACCTRFCDIEAGDQQCEAMPGTSCTPVFEQGTAPPGYENVGACVLLEWP